MTTDIATITGQGSIEVLPPARPRSAEAIGQLMAHAEAMNAAHQLAAAMCASELVPAVYRGKPDNGAAAILYGAELGLTPIQSLQQIFVVHGQPAIYARTAVAMVKRHGIRIETVSSTDEGVTVRATDQHTGHVEESTWTVERAKRAGYTSNKKYETDPQAMLYAKAAMECCRKIAPDVLLGLANSREELELEAQPAPRRVESQRGVAALADRYADRGPAVVEAPGPEVSPPDDPARKKNLTALGRLLKKVDVTGAEDALIVTRKLVGRDPQGAPITSSADLTDAELDDLVVKLTGWEKAGTLGGEVTEILNAATLADCTEQEN